MNVPFPGMDPYLEHPVLWEGLHARLIVALANQLQPRLDRQRGPIHRPRRNGDLYRHLDANGQIQSLSFQRREFHGGQRRLGPGELLDDDHHHHRS